jgi:predicted RNase H-like HicB family nuclease
MGTQRKDYRAVYTYDRNYWVVQFDDPDVSTFASTLSKAIGNAREALAATLDYDSVEAMEDAGVVIQDLVSTANVSTDDIDVLRRHRSDIDAVSKEIQEYTERVARVLAQKDGLSLRDVATAVGVSHQRVAQILDKDELVDLIGGPGTYLGNYRDRLADSIERLSHSGPPRTKA